MSNQRLFDIIEFTGQPRQYYGDGIKMPEILLKQGKYVKASTVAIPLGYSRYGGPVVDLPPGVDYPAGLRFAAQLDLAQFASFDKSGLLPPTGQLLFFADIVEEVGKVIYADVLNDQLVRVVREHDDQPEDEDEVVAANEEGKVWDYFAGSERSKLFGIYTNCQLPEAEVLAVVESNRVLLLQVGEGSFNEERVFSVLVDKEALQKRDFDKCTFTWAQS